MQVKWNIKTQKWEKKRKTLTKKLRESPGEKHTQTHGRLIDNHKCLSWSEESKCIWTHGKDSATSV